jgi:hypothetical protein
VQVVPEDVNDDGHPDVIILGEDAGEGEGDGAFIVLFDAGLSNVTPVVTPFSIPPGSLYIAVGDLNRDGRADLVLNSWHGGLSGILGYSLTFIGEAGGGFMLRGDSGAGLGRTLLADFNTDGYLDVVGGGIVGAFHKIVSVTLGNGNGEFVVSYPFDAPWPLLVDDFNSDGRPDFISAGFSGPDGNFTVLINTSPYGCLDRVTLTYAAGTLDIGFTIKSLTPTTWSTWIAFQNSFIPLWSLPIPAVPAEVSFTLPIPGFPQIGNVAVLTTMSSPAYGLMCGDLKVVDTGAP